MKALLERSRIFFNKLFGCVCPEDEANAHLIAAAPDMYTMIGELTDMVDKLNEGFNADHKAIELSIKAESLLAKARGEL